MFATRVYYPFEFKTIKIYTLFCAMIPSELSISGFNLHLRHRLSGQHVPSDVINWLN